MKRAFDLTLALIIAVPCAIAILFFFAAISLTSPGAPLLRQVRVGRNESPFTCYKLRSMADGTKTLPTHEISAEAVTPLGGFLRRSKLDELPQIWNVLSGDMSFVGPRPCLPSQTELIKARRALGVNSLRPGITGLSQIAGLDMSEPQRLAHSDARYCGPWSIWRDLAILARTILGEGSGDRTG